MEWTTRYWMDGAERSVPGAAIGTASVAGQELLQERTNRIQVIAASSDALADDGMPTLVEFLDVSFRTLRACATAAPSWTDAVLTVRAESGAIAAFLVDRGDAGARSGALVILELAGLEAAAAERPYADEDPEGFELSDRQLKDRMRRALRRAAASEPARSSIEDFSATARLPIVLDLIGECDRADFEPFTGA